MIKTVIGSFDSYDEAQRVVRDLKDDGFMESDVSIVASNVGGRYDVADRDVTTSPHDTSGAATGAVTGGVVGGAAGLAASLMGLAIPGIGPIIAAGPIVATLTGAGVGAVAGGLIGGLTDLGVSEKDAHYYAESVRRGGALVTVRADQARAEAAADVMRRHGAIDIERRVETWRKTGWTGFDSTAKPYTVDEIDRERSAWRTPAGDASTGMGASERMGSGSYVGTAPVTGGTFGRPRTSAEWDVYEAEFRNDYETNYAGRGGTYDEYAPAYRYGFDSASNYRGRAWEDVEPDLQRDWERNNPGREWARFKAAARRGWQRMSDAIERAVPGDSDRDGK